MTILYLEGNRAFKINSTVVASPTGSNKQPRARPSVTDAEERH
jgi:hypothetical protein